MYLFASQIPFSDCKDKSFFLNKQIIRKKVRRKTLYYKDLPLVSLCFQIKLCPILSWRHTQRALYISGEVVGGVEVQFVGDVGNRQIITFQQSGDFLGRKVIDVEGSIVACGLYAAFRQVMR